MKNIDLLPIPDGDKKKLVAFARMYRQNARIYIDVISFKDNELIIRVEEKELVTGKPLTRAELIERAAEMFEGSIPTDWHVIITAANFNGEDISHVDVGYIKRNMERLGLKQKHLVKYLNVNKSTISTLLSDEEKELTQFQKAAFYYMFKYFEFSGFKN